MLVAAAGACARDTVEMLLRCGADPNYPTVSAETSDALRTPTALMRAAYDGEIAICTALLAHGADINGGPPWHECALLAALREGRDDCAMFLLDAGARTDIADPYGNTALMRAIEGDARHALARILPTGGPSLERNAAPFQLTAFGEVLADRANRVTLDPVRRDVHGLPVARLGCRYGANEHAMAADMVDWLGELVEACALEPRSTDVVLPVPGSSIHELGGARMGDDPRTSVVDRWNRCWAAPNVVVCDGSAFVSSGCQNPTLTMIALTIRACEHAVAELRAG